MNYIKVFLSVFFLYISLINAQTTYFISSSEGNDSFTGTSASSPWKSLNKLHSSWNLIGPGDQILFKRGDTWAPNYTDLERIGLIRIPNLKNGTENNPIILGAYGQGEKPLLSSENVTGYHQLIRSGALEYFEFKDLHFIGQVYLRANENLVTGLNFIKFTNCTFENESIILFTGFNGQQSLIPESNNDNWAKVKNISFLGCTFLNCSGNGGTINFAPYENCYIGYNKFFNCTEEAIDLAGGTGHVIEYNIISGTTVNGIKLHSQFSLFENAIVRGNLIIRTGNGTTEGAGLGLQNVQNCKVYNNTIFGPQYAALFGNRDRLPPESYFGNFEGNEIRNNIFFGMVQITGAWENVVLNGIPMPYKNMGNSLFEDNIFSNNTFWTKGVNNYIVRFWKNDGYPIQYNDYVYRDINKNDQSSFNTYWADKTSGEDFMRAISFVDTTWVDFFNYGDFRLGENSLDINSGFSLPDYTTDLKGDPVPQGNAPERGAYEVNEGDLTPPRINQINVIDKNHVIVFFSESIELTSATNIENYQIEYGGNQIEIYDAFLLVNQSDVILNTADHDIGEYIMTVDNITDILGNQIDTSNNTFIYNYSISNELDVEVCYDFIGGPSPNIIYDRSGNGEKKDLIIENIEDVTWLNPRGLRVHAPTKIVSEFAFGNIVEACRITGEISIEVWLKPDNVLQSGPARIVSMSSDPSNRNFTLGQGINDGATDVYDFRLRTTESNNNGIPSISTGTGVLTTELTHLVYTRNAYGLSKIYVNNNEVICDTLGGDFSNWDSNYHLVLANEFTGDRPWLGELYKLCIYNRMLNGDQIDSLYNIPILTDVKSEFLTSPTEYKLSQNYPNPFNPSTTIKFSLPEYTYAKLKIYDVLGREVSVLFEGYLTAGVHIYDFDASELVSSVYFYKLETQNFSETKKMLLIK